MTSLAHNANEQTTLGESCMDCFFVRRAAGVQFVSQNCEPYLCEFFVSRLFQSQK